MRQSSAKASEWSNGTYSLLLDTLELDFALDEDFAELLDRSSTGVEDDERTELLDCGVTLELDFALLLDCAELLLDTLVSLSLDFGVTLEDDFALLLDCGVTLSLLDEVGSSSRGAKLLSSSPQATTKNAKRRANKKCINPPNPFYLKYTFFSRRLPANSFRYVKKSRKQKFFGSFWPRNRFIV